MARPTSPVKKTKKSISLSSEEIKAGARIAKASGMSLSHVVGRLLIQADLNNQYRELPQ